MQDADDTIEANTTLTDLLRKLNDGDAANVFGAEVQAYFVSLRKAAKKHGKRVLGRITLEIAIPMGADGYALPVGKLKTKEIPRPPWPESTIYIDEDGDINGRPVAKQVTLKEVIDRKSNEKNPAAPAAKGM